MKEELNLCIIRASEAQDMDSLERAMIDFAKILCEKQKQICADHAVADYTVIGNSDDENRIESYDLTNLEVYVLKESILQAPNAI